MARQGLPRIPDANATETESKAAAQQPEAEAAAAAPNGDAGSGLGAVAPAGPRRGLPRPTVAAGTSSSLTVDQGPATAAAVESAAEHAGQSMVAASGDRVPVGSPSQVRKPGRFEKLRSSRLGRLAVLGLGLLAALAACVLAARTLVTLEPVQGFLARYPGETELLQGAPVGFPAWLAWQHFFNIFLMVLIIRSGWQVRTQRRPPATWTARWGKSPKKISINLWLHQSLDILWLANGAIFVLLLIASGQWMRIVPTSWEVFPNALSAVLQYASLNWPTENGWVNYNSLQVLAYFVTIFVAAPLAAITGFRMSEAWPGKAERLSKAYPIEVARAIHLPVMFYFVGFIIVHVALVLSTGALRNLNHMYGGQDVVNWYGFWIFFVSLLVIAAGWLAARPLVLAPIASIFGKVGR